MIWDRLIDPIDGRVLRRVGDLDERLRKPYSWNISCPAGEPGCFRGDFYQWSTPILDVEAGLFSDWPETSPIRADQQKRELYRERPDGSRAWTVAVPAPERLRPKTRLMPWTIVYSKKVQYWLYEDAARAIDLETGNILWEVREYIAAAELAGDKLVGITGSRGHTDAICIDVSNGRILFRKPLAAPFGAKLTSYKDRFFIYAQREDVFSRQAAACYELTIDGQLTLLSNNGLYALDDTDFGYVMVRDLELALLYPTVQGVCTCIHAYEFPDRDEYELSTEGRHMSRWGWRRGGIVVTRGRYVFALMLLDIRVVSDLVCFDLETGRVVWTANCAGTAADWEDSKPSQQITYIELRGNELIYVAQGPTAFLAVFDTDTGKLLRRFDYSNRWE